MTDIIASLKRMAMDCAAAQDDGTSEGAKKGWMTRKQAMEEWKKHSARQSQLSMYGVHAAQRGDDAEARHWDEQSAKHQNEMDRLAREYNLFPENAEDKSVAEDYGTPEGAKKAAETRRNGGGGQSEEDLDALARHNALQKANWEEMQGHSGSGYHHHPMYTGFRESAKVDTLLSGKSPEWEMPISVKEGGKKHDTAEAGARAAQREIKAQKSALQRYLESNPTKPVQFSRSDGMKPNPAPRVRDVGGTYKQYGTTVMMRGDGKPTREMPHWDNHDKSVRQMRRLPRAGW